MFVWLGLKRNVSVRRLVSLLVLFALCASFVPLPTNSKSPLKKDLSTPYPCQNRPCGCRSAEQCWKSCCCFSNREKVAWSKANRVTPPTYVIAAAKQEATESVCQTEGCCTKQKKSSQQEIVVSSSENCCTSSDEPEKTTSFEVSAEENETFFVIGVFAQKCQGQGPFWNSLPWAILPEVQAMVSYSDLVVWTRPTSTTAPRSAAEPPEPPPRLMVNSTSVA
ncbi:hypothetical protein [Gimesia aquarii]|uniref:Uncharacterized protein n=1 Tax=Gimesia aquarii TaxID=2527964 RepID=A0A517W2A2_9PLAN|nr:hypothetical protein [Gimesia aquarii]QDT99381.1 hypothetical protein V144x_48920 [Gimesia aquarii]